MSLDSAENWSFWVSKIPDLEFWDFYVIVNDGDLGGDFWVPREADISVVCDSAWVREVEDGLIQLKIPDDRSSVLGGRTKNVRNFSVPGNGGNNASLVNIASRTEHVRLGDVLFNIMHSYFKSSTCNQILSEWVKSDGVNSRFVHFLKTDKTLLVDIS